MKKEIRNTENGLENMYLEIIQVKNTHPSKDFGNNLCKCLTHTIFEF